MATRNGGGYGGYDERGRDGDRSYRGGGGGGYGDDRGRPPNRYGGGYGGGGGGGDGRPDRSRSRDRQDDRGGYRGHHGGDRGRYGGGEYRDGERGGAYRYGGGRGGGRGGGWGPGGGGGSSGGGGRGRGGPLPPRPTSAMVTVNYHRLIYEPPDGAGPDECVQYEVKMLDAKVARGDDPEGDGSRAVRRDRDGRPIVVPVRRGGRYRRLDLEGMAKTANPLPRRIMTKLMRNEVERLMALGRDEEAARFKPAYDGAMAAYAPRRLFTPANEGTGEGVCSIPAPAAPSESHGSGSGVYGPADDRTPRPENGDGPPGDPDPDSSPYDSDRSGPGVYHVRVNKDCDEDDPDTDRVKKAWYIVILTEAGFIQLSALQGQAAAQAHDHNQSQLMRNQALAQCVNTILRSAKISTGAFAAVRGSPYTFFKSIPPDHVGVFGRALNNIYRGQDQVRSKRGTLMPSVGVCQALKLCLSGNVFGGGPGAGGAGGRGPPVPLVKMDAKAGFFDRSRTYTPDPNGEPAREIPIINEFHREIAGVAVRDLNHLIDNTDLQKKVETALRKKLFNVWYMSNDLERQQRWRREGLSENEIQERRRCVRAKNTTLKPDRNRDNVCIIWNPSSFTFEVRPRHQNGAGTGIEQGGDGGGAAPAEEAPVLMTIPQYYQHKYNITLRFPKMPIIHIGKGNWFPIEFLYQAFSEAKGANLGEVILDEKDENAGPRLMQNLRRIYGALPPGVAQFIQNGFNLRIDSTPQQLEAKVLREPTLRLRSARNSELVPASIRNGSWGLRDTQFIKPSCMNSFGIIDLSRKGSALDYLSKQFPVCDQQGIVLPDHPRQCSNDIARKVVVHHPTAMQGGDAAGEISGAFVESIKKSREFFVHDTSGYFKNNSTWFRGLARNEKGGVSECLVVPNPSPERDRSRKILSSSEVGLMLPEHIFPTTHAVTMVHGSERIEKDARLLVRVHVSGQTIDVDPFDTRCWEGQCQIRQNNGQWIDAQHKAIVYKLIEEGTIMADNQVEEPIPVTRVANSTVECPAMIFVVLPEKDGELYSVVKQNSSFQFGVPSQCIVESKFQSQRHPDQYCSNVAISVNTKLSNKWNGGRAWNTVQISQEGHVLEGLPWHRELPTMIMGVSMSHGQGQNNISVVVAHAYLDQFGMQPAPVVKIQKKSATVSNLVMKSITKSLALQFELYTGVKPTRVLVYRDGMSDGSFPKAINEISSIRQAFYDQFASEDGFSCPNEVACAQHGCIFCTPPITFISCQNDHGIKLVPSENHQGVSTGRGVNVTYNVHSGTCLDHTIIEEMQQLGIDQPAGGDGVAFYAQDPGSSYDFLLTAQGGLKGTSKPVYYRVLLNENAVYDKSGGTGTPLTRNVLEQLTYHMSFMYGKATKAVRSVPVVHYSRSLANQAMKWVNDLIQRKQIVHHVQEDGDDVEFSRVSADGENSELLPAFSPFDPEQQDILTSPYRPCGMLCAMPKGN